jgi:fructosamine-3-kinase
MSERAAALGAALAAVCGGEPELAPRGGAHGVARWRVARGAQRWFAKSAPAADAARLAYEARGLAALAAVPGWRVPAVVAQGMAAGVAGEQAFLLVEHLALVPRDARSDAALGAALAAAHARHAPRFGWDADGWLGATPQPNGWCDDAVTFQAERRLGPQLALARADGAPARLVDAVARVIEVLPALHAEHRPSPALLHGDLWSGNAAALADGTPVVFDPAVHHGDPEADLAMAELFGGFAPTLLASYAAHAPLAAGYPLRRELHQLYHLLNHHHLFGGGYAADALRAAERLLAATRG